MKYWQGVSREGVNPSLPVKDIIREILEYIPMDIPFKKGAPKNID
jgi:hypothetical protein